MQTSRKSSSSKSSSGKEPLMRSEQQLHQEYLSGGTDEENMVQEYERTGRSEESEGIRGVTYAIWAALVLLFIDALVFGQQGLYIKNVYPMWDSLGQWIASIPMGVKQLLLWSGLALWFGALWGYKKSRSDGAKVLVGLVPVVLISGAMPLLLGPLFALGISLFLALVLVMISFAVMR